ncbi:hypothetical protein AFLA_000116 [Aspergillus flavus NRRL3357]|nr:hypothetical protein AFLA_000116 [Aspergillus flavus NRRL3357]
MLRIPVPLQSRASISWGLGLHISTVDIHFPSGETPSCRITARESLTRYMIIGMDIVCLEDTGICRAVTFMGDLT